MSSKGPLAVCQSGYEGMLAREMEGFGLAAAKGGPGWVMAEQPRGADGRTPFGGLEGAAFPHSILEAPAAISGERVNELALGIVEWFADGVRGERVDGAWPCIFSGPQDVAGLGRRVAAVEAAFHERLRKRLGRIARLASADKPRLGAARGLFVWFADFGTAHVARSAFMNGPSRMADDDAAPSRSYLKIEESYAIVGREPGPGESVCDLGAAPGGWSYSAAKRGARVVAVDNGPMKGGALGHPLIDHRRADAFGFSPGRNAVYDWLFCDLLEDPHKVLELIVSPWLAGGWCRRFVVNLKFGRGDPIALLGELRAPDSPLAANAAGVRIVHLYHDREEFTVTGTVAR
ncbi:MAG TPA: SAM-dependent methyltransferase [Opitutaceae bacterium]|nr:SAM-dependent methyltransferase [Opitutaceae bacterium]